MELYVWVKSSGTLSNNGSDGTEQLCHVLLYGSHGRRLPANLMSARRVSSLSETVHLHLLGQSSGTVSLMTLHRPHCCQYSERNRKHTYFGNHIRTLFSSLLWFFVAIVVLEDNCYLGHVKNVM